jgi:heme-degrading monooxygenase HmoA
LRIWRAKIDPARLEEYRRFERGRCLPMLHKQPGLLEVLFLRYAEDHAASLTIWEDRGAVEALESSPSYRRTVRELAEGGLLEREVGRDLRSGRRCSDGTVPKVGCGEGLGHDVGSLHEFQGGLLSGGEIVPAGGHYHIIRVAVAFCPFPLGFENFARELRQPSHLIP